MRLQIDRWIRSQMRARAARQWGRIAKRLRNGGRSPSATIREEARRLHAHLSTVLRLSSPVMLRDHASLSALPLPLGTDWRWRPAIFSGRANPHGIIQPTGGQQMGDGLAIWHDCPHRAMAVQQIRSQRSDDLVPFGLRIETFGFSGSYASLSIELPEPVLDQLDRYYIIRVQAEMQAEMPVRIYCRANLVQGPNVEKIMHDMGDGDIHERGMQVAEFDLSFADLALKPISKVWVDFIFSSPYMNSISVSDIVVSRYPRAEI